MNVNVCKSCRQLFNYSFGPKDICPNCRQKEEELFQDVKKYINDHPGCSISSVCEECEVSNKKIQQWIREERLEFSSGCPDLDMTCEKCGKPIITGKLCTECKEKLKGELSGAIKELRPEPQITKEEKTKNKNKMRFL